MNHNVEYPKQSQKEVFANLREGEFFLFDNNLYVKTSNNRGICLAINTTPCFKQECVFFPDTFVQMKEVTITVH